MKRILIAAGVTSLLAALLLITHPTAASQFTPSTPPVGLTVSPVRAELDIKPGSSYDGDLRVSNNTDNALSVSLSAEAFNVINSQYNYSFDPTSSIVRWVTFTPARLTLEAGNFQTVHYTIAVPLGAEPHGEYISLFASVENQTPVASSISTDERVASLLYVTIDGNVSRNGQLISLQNPWLTTTNFNWTASVRNKGTTHFRSLYTTTTRTIFGGQVGASGSGSALILPGTIRTVEGNSAIPQFPGIYKVVYTFGLGDTPATTTTHYFLYVPLVPSVLIIACLFVIIGYIPARKMKFGKEPR